jgi:hypothetical protein
MPTFSLRKLSYFLSAGTSRRKLCFFHRRLFQKSKVILVDGGTQFYCSCGIKELSIFARSALN